MNHWIVQKYLGESAALGVAISSAVASVIYSRVENKITPLLLNLSKGLIAFFLAILTFYLNQQEFPNFFSRISALLILGGGIGIGLGDTAYFLAMPLVGVRKLLLLQTLSIPFAILLGSLFLGEYLTMTNWLAMILIIIGIAIVIAERTEDNQQDISWIGIVWSIISALCTATGAVLSHFAFHNSHITSLDALFLRLYGAIAAIFLLLLLPSYKNDRRFFFNFQWLSPKLFWAITLASFLNAYLGIWLQQFSLKFTTVGIAQILCSTSPLFVLPIVAAMGEKVSIRSIGGVILTLFGIALLFSF